MTEQIAQSQQVSEQELLDMLVDVVWQACAYDGEMDSMGISTYADALRLLARCGRAAIVLDAGKRVRATMVAESVSTAEVVSEAPAGLYRFRYPVLLAEEASAQLVRLAGRAQSGGDGSQYGEPVTGLYLRNGQSVVVGEHTPGDGDEGEER